MRNAFDVCRSGKDQLELFKILTVCIALGKPFVEVIDFLYRGFTSEVLAYQFIDMVQCVFHVSSQIRSSARSIRAGNLSAALA